jgi:hypothetical protein
MGQGTRRGRARGCCRLRRTAVGQIRAGAGRARGGTGLRREYDCGQVRLSLVTPPRCGLRPSPPAPRRT